jgi:hypothetical protein
MRKDLYLIYKRDGFHPVETEKVYHNKTSSNGAINILDDRPIAIPKPVVTLLRDSKN